MVRLHVKKGDESQFLYDTHVEARVEDVIYDVTVIYNGRLKISRICYEIEALAKHGTMLPHDMMGLTDDQIAELKLKDEWGERCTPMGGWNFNKDVVGRRNGRQPSKKMQEVLTKTIEEARNMISKKLVQQDKLVTLKTVQEAMDLLRGAVTIVYPMGLPPHDVIRQEFENTEDLSGTQASLEVIDVQLAQIWFSGKEMLPGKKVKDFLGPNEKTKVIVKLQKRGGGRPAREPLMSEDERKQLMLHAYRRQEQLKLTVNILPPLSSQLMAEVDATRYSHRLSSARRLASLQVVRVDAWPDNAARTNSTAVENVLRTACQCRLHTAQQEVAIIAKLADQRAST